MYISDFYFFRCLDNTSDCKCFLLISLRNFKNNLRIVVMATTFLFSFCGFRN